MSTGNLKVIILGAGGSAGVPLIGNYWGACDPKNPKNRRTRPSILIELQGKKILIDTSPDLKEQFLRENVENIDAVLYTHAHADHSLGLNDLSIFSKRFKKQIPLYGDEHTIADLKIRFNFLLDNGHLHSNLYPPRFVTHVLPVPNDKPYDFDVKGISITAFTQDHFSINTIGYRIGNFAYTTDAKQLGPHAFKALEGIHTWIVDCAKIEPHSTHSHLSQTLDWIKIVKPRRAILHHMQEHLDYEQLKQCLPQLESITIEPGYDGLLINL